MTSDEAQTEPRPGDDRRAFLKKAGVAGAVAWTAPVIFEGVASAGLCTTSPTVTGLGTATRNTQLSTTTSITVPITNTTAGASVIVFINAQRTTSPPPSQSISSLTGTAVAGSPAPSQLQQVLDYNNNTTQTFDFFAWQFTGSGTAGGSLTVNFGLPVQYIGVAVLQVVGATPQETQTGTGNNSATATTAPYSAVPPVNNAEVWGVAGGDNSTTSFSWNQPGAPNAWTEVHDFFVTNVLGASRSFAMETAYRIPAQQASGSFTTNPNTRNPDWAAIRVLLGC